MAGRSFLRGHPLIWLDGRWVYEDDHLDPLVRGGKPRPCKKCGAVFPWHKVDPCLGVLPGAHSACCGHGGSESYVRFTTGVVLKGFIVTGRPGLTDQGGNMLKRIFWVLLRLPVILLCLLVHPLDEELAHDLRKWAGLDW